MKKKIAVRWIAALRSGDYKQAIGYLHQGDRFCVMGVLCDLHAREHNKKWRFGDGLPNPYGAKRYLGVMRSAPYDVLKWAGLENSRTFVQGLENANDNGANFDYMIERIEWLLRAQGDDIAQLDELFGAKDNEPDQKDVP